MISSAQMQKKKKMWPVIEGLYRNSVSIYNVAFFNIGINGMNGA